MKIHLIWAQDTNGGIGKNGKLPWHISEDLKKFKSLTYNSTVIMGRKTWDSLPIKPLPNRSNIVLSTKQQNDVITYSSFEGCYAEINKQQLEKVFIIGGRSIYKLFYEYADYLHITNINYIKKDVNEFFPISMNTIKSEYKQISKKKLSNQAEYTYWEKKYRV